jgi:hypothetical protein
VGPTELTETIEHAPENAMDDPDEIARFHDGCSDLMRELLDALAREFGGRRPYRFYDSRNAASRRPEMWMDASQARAVRAAERG